MLIALLLLACDEAEDVVPLMGRVVLEDGETEAVMVPEGGWRATLCALESEPYICFDVTWEYATFNGHLCRDIDQSRNEVACELEVDPGYRLIVTWLY